MAEVQKRLPRKPQRRKLAADKKYAEKNFLTVTVEQGFDPHIELQTEEEEQLPSWKKRTFRIDVLKKRKQKVQWAKARNYVRQLNRQPVTAYVRHLRKRIEHLFAEAKEWHGLRRARGRRLWRVQQQVTMTAIVQNLKRMSHSLHRPSPAGEGAGLTSPCFNPIPLHFYIIFFFFASLIF